MEVPVEEKQNPEAEKKLPDRAFPAQDFNPKEFAKDLIDDLARVTFEELDFCREQRKTNLDYYLELKNDPKKLEEFCNALKLRLADPSTPYASPEQRAKEELLLVLLDPKSNKILQAKISESLQKGLEPGSKLEDVKAEVVKNIIEQLRPELTKELIIDLKKQLEKIIDREFENQVSEFFGLKNPVEYNFSDYKRELIWAENAGIHAFDSEKMGSLIEEIDLELANEKKLLNQILENISDAQQHDQDKLESLLKELQHSQSKFLLTISNLKSEDLIDLRNDLLPVIEEIGELDLTQALQVEAALDGISRAEGFMREQKLIQERNDRLDRKSAA